MRPSGVRVTVTPPLPNPERIDLMRSLYLKAVNHIVSLGFSRDTAESIAGMELDGLDGREAHYEMLLEMNTHALSELLRSLTR